MYSPYYKHLNEKDISKNLYNKAIVTNVLALSKEV